MGYRVTDKTTRPFLSRSGRPVSVHDSKEILAFYPSVEHSFTYSRGNIYTYCQSLLEDENMHLHRDLENLPKCWVCSTYGLIKRLSLYIQSNGREGTTFHVWSTGVADYLPE